jgi:hypothetical protein
MVDPFWGISPRQALQFMGTDVMREAYPRAYDLFAKTIGSDFWLKKAEQFITNNPGESIVIPDTRFQNEVDFVHKLGGKVYKVVRFESIPKKIEHPSEDIDALKGVDGIILNNSSIVELSKLVVQLVESL